jgi:hypothetical protein
MRVGASSEVREDELRDPLWLLDVGEVGGSFDDDHAGVGNSFGDGQHPVGRYRGSSAPAIARVGAR